MTEEEHETYLQDIEELPGGDTLERDKTTLEIQADIARQLTRIADQGDQTPNDETWELVQALIKISKAPCLSQLSGDPPEDFQPCGCASCVAKAALDAYESTSPTPAPDALVEAVKKVIDKVIPHKHEMAYFVIWKDYITALDTALAAHEKAGG